VARLVVGRRPEPPPQNIGTLTATGEWNYTIVIRQPDNDPGAVDILDVNLDENDPDFYTVISDGEITGDLVTSFALQRSTGGEGGIGAMTIGDDLLGDLTMYAPGTSGFSVEDDVAGDLTITLSDGNGFTIKGDVLGAGSLTKVIINLGNISDNAFQIGGTVNRFVDINVTQIASGATLRCGYLSANDVPMQGIVTFSGDLTAGAAIDMSKALIDAFGDLLFGSNDIDGTITVYHLTGDIVARDLAGTVEIKTEFESAASLDLAGSMSGTFSVNTDQGGNNFIGEVLIDGDMTGSALIKMFKGTAGNFTSDAVIQVGGANGIGSSASILLEGTMQGLLTVSNDLTGSVTVGGNFSGDVSIGDEFSSGADFNVGSAAGAADMLSGASFTVVGNSGGDFWVSGDVKNGALLDLNNLGADGRILIDGECDGDIFIDEDTNATSLIQIIKGLTLNGLIVINEDENDAFDANGDIFIGNPDTCATCDVDPVEYDGVINVLNGSSGGGDLAGDISVIGCHDDDNLFELCVCGSETGSKSVVQTGCEEPIVDPPYFTCTSNPCN